MGVRQLLGFAGQGSSIWLRMRVLGELRVAHNGPFSTKKNCTVIWFKQTFKMSLNHQGQDHVGPYELRKETEFFS